MGVAPCPCIGGGASKARLSREDPHGDPTGVLPRNPDPRAFPNPSVGDGDPWGPGPCHGPWVSRSEEIPSDRRLEAGSWLGVYFEDEGFLKILQHYPWDGGVLRPRVRRGAAPACWRRRRGRGGAHCVLGIAPPAFARPLPNAVWRGPAGTAFANRAGLGSTAYPTIPPSSPTSAGQHVAEKET
eukprot:gene17283-biopygen6784